MRMTTPTYSWSGLTIDCREPEPLSRFWAALLDLETTAALPGWVRLHGSGRDHPVISFQPVPERKQGKTRIHLDLTVDDADAGVARVLELGGRGPHERHHYAEGVVSVMSDPEGNEFCITQYFTDVADDPAASP